MSTTEGSSLPRNLQPDDLMLTDECRELMGSLQSEKGWVLSSSTLYYLYQGFWYGALHMNGTLLTQRHFRSLDSDILLVTTPKSGTTWLKAIIFALLNRSCYSEPANRKLDHPLLHKNPHKLVPFLEVDIYTSKDPYPDLSNFNSPRLFATHIPLRSLPESVKDSKCKLVYLCRNPRDTFVSLWHFLNKLTHNETEMGIQALEGAFDMFCKGVSLYGPYWDHVLDYYKASLEMPHKVLFLKYEEMKDKQSEHLKRLADFLGCPLSEDEEANVGVDEILRLCSFDNLSKLEVNQTGKLELGLENKFFFRKGEVGDWVNYLTPEKIERLDRITEEKIGSSGLKL
ncbi:cytosolic sulfotransferase 5-like [Punica granatum]|uniref:Sulfotransferase n=2 Tax=Punica granatum TaxID=22663 RepID=A0A218XXA4_PUNGR|nr:cytosolic sulfotransferase 5-like [Punica granatum]OWM89450.1 hypothetical protein CDL15_Pgr024198 [Punica granatum]PKI62473.1 hypothetical protein CRG98_017097 [Punica granatum]